MLRRRGSGMIRAYCNVWVLVGLMAGLCAATPSMAGVFGTALSENTTVYADSVFLGPPDGPLGASTSGRGVSWGGIGTDDVIYDFGSSVIVNGSGVDFVIYEVEIGLAEFGQIDVYVSVNGTDWNSTPLTAMDGVDIPGDSGQGSTKWAKGYDLTEAGLSAARFIWIDGTSGGASLPNASRGFDLDGVGVVPEPGTSALLGIGLALLVGTRRYGRAPRS
jgi:hypothetical protein